MRKILFSILMVSIMLICMFSQVVNASIEPAPVIYWPIDGEMLQKDNASIEIDYANCYSLKNLTTNTVISGQIGTFIPVTRTNPNGPPTVIGYSFKIYSQYLEYSNKYQLSLWKSGASYGSPKSTVMFTIAPPNTSVPPIPTCVQLRQPGILTPQNGQVVPYGDVKVVAGPYTYTAPYSLWVKDLSNNKIIIWGGGSFIIPKGLLRSGGRYQIGGSLSGASWGQMLPTSTFSVS
ncbi:MAG: hypothetical protein N2645_02740 [Clostridia bacterium]|nr:hypothetical protein [Clostridia bacterium]